MNAHTTTAAQPDPRKDSGRVELIVKVARVAASEFSATCADLSGHGKTPAAALSHLVSQLCRCDELQGFFWREEETGVSGLIARPKKKNAAAKRGDKGAVFDLLGGKMNGDRRMRDE